MTIELRTPTTEECGHWYCGPEGQFACTGDYVRIVRDLGDVSECDIWGGRCGVILSNEWLKNRVIDE